ncbi:MAG TPA: radical SAM protein [Bacteroidales bacterium]|nr:radical SAM protein [Bacteroidales bacterium]
MKKNPVKIIYGTRARLINGAGDLFYFLLTIMDYRSLSKGIRVMKRLHALQMEIAGHKLCKLVRAHGRYHWNMHLPGFPSGALTEHVRGEMNRLIPVRKKHNRLSTLFFGITNRCPMSCRHCYEWEALNHKDTLSLPEMKKIIGSFRQQGVSHIQFGGGEPMARFSDLVELIRESGPGPDLWISTCGFIFSEEKAHELKKAGLTGVAISLDHYIPELHNEFRGHPKAFDWAMTATENCHKAGLVTCWSLCVTREFVSRDNLYRYALLAMQNGVSYVQLFEAMPSGRFKGQDVALNPAEIGILEDFYTEMNTLKKYQDFPMIVYMGKYQRRIGCLGAGNRYVYVDTFGNIQSCPFCRNREEMKVNEHPIPELLQWIMEQGCSHTKERQGAL